MKKNFKKVLTAALAGVMALGAVVGLNPTTVKADETPVELTLASDGQVRAEGDPTLVYRVNIFNSWTGDANDILTDASSFDGATKVEVTFTVSGLGSKTGKAGINMSNGDWGDVQYWFDERTAVTATDVELTADGQYTVALETTGDYKFDTVAFMDLQTDIAADDGEKDTAITSGIDIKIDKIVVTGGKDVAVAGSEDTTEPATDEPVASGTFDPAGSYNAYFGLQSPSWTYRDAWNADNGIGSDNWGQWVINNDSAQTYGVVTDAEVAGNGTYTVSLKDFGTVFSDEFANNSDGLDKFRILMITTNIPLSDDVKITDVKLIMDGKTIKTYSEAFLDPDDTEYVKILVQNEWNSDLKETLPYYAAPTESIELQFTISGFNYDNENAVAGSDDAAADESTTAATTDTNKATDASANISTEKADDDSNMTTIIIVVVVVVVVIAAVAVVVSKKKKN